MQQFIIPQFLDVEDKIIGPLTVRQFITFLAGAGLIFIVFKLASFWIAAIEGVLLFALTGMFAFLKINGRPFHYFLLNLIQTLRRPTLKLWNKQINEKEQKKPEKIKPPQVIAEKKQVSASRLSELSLLVDTGGAYSEPADEV
ncbi:PrgI family protein [Patescibacteria group bacterium]|nr:PrgI family protein [Patescibacteria group bacterium]MBU0963622.1 PrgI family protein [Patescibacteria group bacterium]